MAVNGHNGDGIRCFGCVEDILRSEVTLKCELYDTNKLLRSPWGKKYRKRMATARYDGKGNLVEIEVWTNWWDRLLFAAKNSMKKEKIHDSK